MCASGEIVKMCVKVTHNYCVPTPQEDTFKFKKKIIKPQRNLTVRNDIKKTSSTKTTATHKTKPCIKRTKSR